MIEFTTGLLMLASVFTPATTNKIAEAGQISLESVQASAIVYETIAPIIAVATTTQPLGIAETEIIVRHYFKDTPILAEIAKCESSFRQHDKDGNVLLGRVNSDDVGVMQINLFYHGDTAEKLGYDIYTLKGNLDYAKALYGKSGDKPWVHSSKCWSKSAAGQA
ncbi:MAG: hypothetical protein Q8L64_04855 [bacterium]|nr:hypothetical protein [bacterium]